MFTNKRAQLTVFIIIAIVVIAAVVVYFFVIGSGPSKNDQELLKVFNYYSSCIEEQTKRALDIAGTQAGYVNTPPYISGSEFAPFSNQLNFMGISVPYWYYISANGVIKEKIPTKQEIENQVAGYVQEEVKKCDFENFYILGYAIKSSEPVAKISIEENKVVVNLENDMSVSRDGVSSNKKVHRLEITSKFGKFFRLAQEIYSKEKSEAFLENYSVDILRLNAPVDGVELSCSPKIWKTREVEDSIKNALEANIGFLKLKGDYYSLQNKDNQYFVIDKTVDESINFIYSKQWSTKLSITGDGVDDELMTAQTVGNQEGLGIMGFCYAPYHFVYDLSYPVLIQIYDGEDLFQFPVAVVIDKNVPRNAQTDGVDITEEKDFNLCSYKSQDVQVNVFDINLNPINANLSFECFQQSCNIGETKNGTFIGKAPACINGFINSKSSGYEDKRQLFSSNDQYSVDVIMDKQFDLNVSLLVGGKSIKGNAMAIFSGVNGTKSKTISFPEMNEISLSEGIYEVSVFVYSNSSITIPESKKTQCTDVPKSGIAGFFGSTKQECFDITIPETKIDYALVGGGKTVFYLLPEQLEKGQMTISVDEMLAPSSIEQLQNNFVEFDTKEVGIDFG